MRNLELEPGREGSGQRFEMASCHAEWADTRGGGQPVYWTWADVVRLDGDDDAGV